MQLAITFFVSQMEKKVIASHISQVVVFYSNERQT